MRGILQRLKQKIVDRDYYLSSHAEEEMVNDGLTRQDVEHAILKGRLEKRMTKDLRGPRYRIEGAAKDGRMVHVMCRLDEEDTLRIITVYALPE